MKNSQYKRDFKLQAEPLSGKTISLAVCVIGFVMAMIAFIGVLLIW